MAHQKIDVDFLTLYRGDVLKITDEIELHIPTLGEICEYGEHKYYSMVNTLCSVGIDLCWQLDEIGVNFEEIGDFQLFYSLLCKNYTVEQTKILFGDILDFSKMKLFINQDDSVYLIQNYLYSVPLKLKNRKTIQIPVGSIVSVLEPKGEYYKIKYNDVIGLIPHHLVSLNEHGDFFITNNVSESIENAIYKKIIINEETYFLIVEYLRAIHNLKRDDRIAGTRSCRMAFIEDAKMEYEAAKLEERKSVLLPFVSTMVNSEGFKRNDVTVWDMNIFAFMDSVKRISKINSAKLLLQSGYSGYGIDLKKIKKEELDFMGELN